MLTHRIFQGLIFCLSSLALGGCGAAGPENARDPSATNESREPGQSLPITTVDIPNATAENNTAANADTEKPADSSPPNEENGVEGGVEGGVVGGIVGGVSSKDFPASSTPIKPNHPINFGMGMTRPTQVSGPPVSAGITIQTTGLWIGRCIIKEDGSVTECNVIKGLPNVDKLLVRNLEAQKYTPVLYQGQAQRVYYMFKVNFK